MYRVELKDFMDYDVFWRVFFSEFLMYRVDLKVDEIVSDYSRIIGEFLMYRVELKVFSMF